MSGKIVTLFRVAGSGKPDLQFERELSPGVLLTDLFQIGLDPMVAMFNGGG